MLKSVVTCIHLNFNILYFSASCKDVNRNKPGRLKYHRKLLPAYVNLMSPDKDGYKGAEKDDKANNHNDNNNGNNNDNNNNSDNNDENSNNSENLRTSNLQNSSSVGHLNNHEDTTKPSHYSYLKKSNIYAPDAKNNKMEDDNKKLHTVSNSFIQSTVGNNINNIINRLRHVSVIDYDNNIVCVISPYHPKEYYLTEMKNIALQYGELGNFIISDYNPQIQHISQIVRKNVDICSNHLKELYTTVYRLENPERHKFQRAHYSNERNEYRKRLASFHVCLRLIHRKNYRAITYAELIILNTLDSISCNWDNNCSTNIYANILKTYMSEISNFEKKKKNDAINKINNIYKSAVDAITKIKSELTPSVTSDTADFVLDEIKYIIDKINIHLEKIKYGSEYVKYINSEKIPQQYKKDDLKSHYIVLVTHYSAFLFSTKHINVLEDVFKNKERILYDVFGKIESALRNKLTTLIDSSFSVSTCNSTISICEEIKSAEPLLASSAKPIERHRIYSNAEIKEAKKKYDEKIVKLEQAIRKAEGFINPLKDIIQFNITQKEAMENRINQIQKGLNALETDRKILEIIDAINNQKSQISKNSKKIKDSSRTANALKTQVQTLKKEIDDDVKLLVQLIEKEKIAAFLREEIK
ncbi:reticulocyte-binding protein 2 (RBP2), like [Plasmodium vivax Brazil I]|uniref:Reticulocyte-binding protein 2 (RBP2), like n=1 Tax=Plasmodium vivax (strain Brazil I) TaxID=1033975 RepID=A0A0J9SPR2_PLAV1|nr:reticulocyte-binding protein 2 (RBP2), like [Plasmodium vivax Brazil I]